MTTTYRYRCSLENSYVWEQKLENTPPPTVCKNDGSALVSGSLAVVDSRLETLNINHETDLMNVGTHTHSQIDAHITDTSNPHSVTKSQIGLGNVTNTLCNFSASVDPTVSNDSTLGYSVGSIWVNTTSSRVFVCLNSSGGAAVWKRVDITDHTLLSNIGTNTHAQIDAHITNVSNPHSVTKSQVGLGNVPNLKVNLNATSAPTVSDDVNDGYSIGSVWIDTVENKVYFCTNSTASSAVWNTVITANTGTNNTRWVISDVKSNAVNGGTFNNGNWIVRTLNTIVGGNSDVTLSSNQITIAAGTYSISGSAPAYTVSNHQCRFRNITDSTTAIVGTSELAQTSAPKTSSRSHFSGIITISSTKVFELQHRCSNTGSQNGFGIAAGNGGTELYSIVNIIKIF